MGLKMDNEIKDLAVLYCHLREALSYIESDHPRVLEIKKDLERIKKDWNF